MRTRATTRNRRVTAAALLLGIVLSTVGVLAPGPAAAAPGDAVGLLPAKVGQPASISGGQTVQYTVNYTCSNNEADVPPDGCDGAVFTDPIPTFTNIYGEAMPLELVSATGPASVWPDGFALVDDPTLGPVIRSTAGTWPPGASGSIFITLRVPAGMVPEGTQVLTNQARLDDPEGDEPSLSPEATTQLVGTGPQWTVGKTGPGTGTRMNRDHEWTVSVCGTSESALWPVFDITDTLPAGFLFVSAERGGMFADDGATPGISDGAATVTWRFDADNRPPLGSDGCFRFRVTGRFPASYEHPDPTDPANEHNVGEAQKVNLATGIGRANDADPGVGLGEAPWTTTLTGPVFGSGSTGKAFQDLAGNSSFYATAGEQGRFQLSATVDSDLLLDRVTLTDGQWGVDGGPLSPGLPSSFTATAIDPGEWNDPVTLTIRGSNDDFATSTVVATGVASGGPDIALAPTYRSFRFEWVGPGIRGDFQVRNLRIIGDLGAPVSELGHYRNVSTLDLELESGQEITRSASDDYVLEAPLPHAEMVKSVSPATRQPGQEATYSLRVRNDRDATGALVEPVVSDCVPAHLEVLSVTAPAPWAEGPSLPACEVGETPLRYTWAGTLNPNQQTSVISVVVRVAASDPGPPAPYGRYENTAFVSPSGGGSFAHCVNVDPSCGNRATIVVAPTVELESRKCVRGELDAGAFRPTPGCTPSEPAQTPAVTTPGGAIDYRLDLRNVGNTDADAIDFIDLLPRVGDTAVISGTPGNLNPRHSEYGPILVSPIDAPEGWTVAYSTAVNPCRPEVGGPSTGCQAPGWTTTPDPAAMSTYRSIKLSHPGVLERGETATFGWQMRAPALDPSYDEGGSSAADPYERLRGCDLLGPASGDHCPRAVNSFAYGADAANLPSGTPQPARLHAEPPQVEVRVTAPQFANAVGDRVWFDRDYDGRQATDTSSAGEPGVPGVRVQLWSADAEQLLAETFTDADGAYRFDSMHPDGDGAFEALPDGDYVLRFFPPAGWYVSPPNAPGIGADEDSDLPRSPNGNDPVLGPYHQTVAIALGDDPNVDLDGDGIPDGEDDPTWDLGLWRAVPSIDIDKVTQDSAWPSSEAGDGAHILQGRPVTWTYTITNTGNARLQAVTVTDDGGPDDGFTVTDCSILDDGVNADGLSSSAVAPMALNRGATMVCTATGIAGAVDYENLGTVVGTPTLDDGTVVTDTPPGYPDLPVVTAEDPSSYLSGAYDLALAKTTGTTDLAAGTASFTVTVQNQGTVASGSYTVTDVLPAGLSYASATPAPASVEGQVVTWVVDVDDELAPGATTTFVLDVSIDDHRARPFRNHAEISADGAALVETGGVPTPTTDVDSTPEDDPVNGDDEHYGPVGDSTDADNQSIADAGVGVDTEDDEDIADLDLDIVYDLALAKVADATALTADEDAAITYTITVENQGNVPSGTYTVTDTLAPGLTPVEPIPGGGVLTGGGDDPLTVAWIAPSIQPGARATFTLDVTVTDLTKRPYRNVAEISSDSAQLLYGVDDIDSTPDADPTNDNAGNGIDEGYGYGPVGSPAPGGVDNHDVSEAGLGNDGEDDADIADVDVPLTGAYDLALAKTVESPVVSYDGTITYTITIQNQGILRSRQVQVTDRLPEGLAVVDLGGAADNGDGTLTWTIDDLVPGETATRTFTARIDDITKRPYRNIAEISSDSADYYSVDGEPISDVDSTPDLDPSNDGDYGPIGSLSPIDNVGPDAITQAGAGEDPEDDADIADVTVEAIVYDLALVKNVLGGIGSEGTASFVITVGNQGNVPSGRYSVADRLPDGLTAIEASDGGVISGDGQLVTWTDLASLEPGGTAALVLKVRVTDYTQRPFVNRAEITADSADSYSTPDETVRDVDSVPGDEETNDVDTPTLEDAGMGDDGGFDDEDLAVLEVSVVYDLALEKRLLPGQRYRLGDVVRYEVEVTNEGNVPSGRFAVADELPEGMELATASHGGSAEGRIVTWTDLDSIEPGQSVVLSYGVRLDDVTHPHYLNRAQITEDSADGYSTDDDPVRDRDSNPGERLGEDDEDEVEIPVEAIRADNLTREPPGDGPRGGGLLPRTGQGVLVLLAMAVALITAGWATVRGGRRRRGG